MKAIVIGPGRIGCGLAGALLREAGYEVVFVARRREIVEHFNRAKQYTVRLVHGSIASETLVEDVAAVWTEDVDEVAKQIAESDLVVTAVGGGNLALIAPLIAEGLRLRRTPVNVLAFENLGTAGRQLRERVEAQLPAALTGVHGFSGVVISRAVTQVIGDPHGDAPLVFVGDAPAETVVDAAGLGTPLPPIDCMTIAESYQAWVERKLFTFSAGHAATAYLGFLKGYHYIHTAIRDPEIRSAVMEAMVEGQRGLAARYGPEVAGNDGDLREIVARFENAALNDPIMRVGRDPERKLGPEDRLVGAARLAEQAGVSPRNLSLAVAAALCFCTMQEISAEEMLDSITLAEDPPRPVGGLECDGKLDHLVTEAWERLAAGWQRDNPLLSLEGMLWAWREDQTPARELAVS